jgi:uncharacterized membrane protein YdbT with pleckstrin-like domain
MPPFDLSSFGKLLVIFAVVIALVGVLLMVLGNVPLFGKLPGDIVIRRGNSTFFFPIVTSIVLSVVLTILINLVLWIFRR